MIEINGFLLVTQVATFLVALAIVWRFFWGPLTRFMRERSERMAADVRRAEEGRREIEALEAEYQRRLAELEQRAQHEIQLALHRGQEAKDRMLLEAREEGRRILERARADLAAERERVVRELREHVSGISLAAVERLLGEGLDAKVQQRLLDQFVSETQSLKRGS